jgi:hypothetical protein
LATRGSRGTLSSGDLPSSAGLICPVPTQDGRYILASAGSDFRTTLGIVTDPDGDLGGSGCTSGAASYGALNDYHLLSGVTYYFRVSGLPEAPNGLESGSAVFILFKDASGYPVFDVDVRLVKATIGRRGQVTLHGTTTCNSTGRATTQCGTRIDLTASQRVGGRLAEGSAVYQAPCDAVFDPDPTTTPPKTCSWHRTLTTTAGRFKPGRLTVDINAIAYNGNGTAVDDHSTTITLTPSKRWPQRQPGANTTAR